jgi:hypothetical protein
MDQDGDIVMLINDSEEAVTRVDRPDRQKIEDRESANGIFDNWRIYNDAEIVETGEERYIVNDKLVDIQPSLSELLPSFPGKKEQMKKIFGDRQEINDTIIAETENEPEENGLQRLPSILQQLPCDLDCDFELRTDIENSVVLVDAKICTIASAELDDSVGLGDSARLGVSADISLDLDSSPRLGDSARLGDSGGLGGGHKGGARSPHEMVVDYSYDYNYYILGDITSPKTISHQISNEKDLLVEHDSVSTNVAGQLLPTSELLPSSVQDLERICMDRGEGEGVCRDWREINIEDNIGSQLDIGRYTVYNKGIEVSADGKEGFNGKKLNQEIRTFPIQNSPSSTDMTISRHVHSPYSLTNIPSKDKFSLISAAILKRNMSLNAEHSGDVIPIHIQNMNSHYKLIWKYFSDEVTNRIYAVHDIKVNQVKAV